MSSDNTTVSKRSKVDGVMHAWANGGTHTVMKRDEETGEIHEETYKFTKGGSLAFAQKQHAFFGKKALEYTLKQQAMGYVCGRLESGTREGVADVLSVIATRDPKKAGGMATLTFTDNFREFLNKPIEYVESRLQSGDVALPFVRNFAALGGGGGSGRGRVVAEDDDGEEGAAAAARDPPAPRDFDRDELVIRAAMKPSKAVTKPSNKRTTRD